MGSTADIEVIYNENGQPLCSARKKHCRNPDCGYDFPKGMKEYACPQCGTDRRCREPVKVAGKRCYYHGGASPVGIASPNWRNGRHSLYMPARLSQRYLQAVGDPELLAVRDDIALVDSRVSDLLERIEKGEAGKLWTEAQEEYKAFRQASARADPQDTREHLAKLDAILGRGVAEFAAWDELGRWLEQRRRLVETEMRRLQKLQQFLTAEQAQMLVVAVGEVVKRHVKNPDTLQAVARDLAGLLSAGTGCGAAADLVPSVPLVAASRPISES
jgi:hypothetical protein